MMRVKEAMMKVENFLFEAMHLLKGYGSRDPGCHPEIPPPLAIIVTIQKDSQIVL
jgi:hypothetical protein